MLRFSSRSRFSHLNLWGRKRWQWGGRAKEGGCEGVKSSFWFFCSLIISLKVNIPKVSSRVTKLWSSSRLCFKPQIYLECKAGFWVEGKMRPDYTTAGVREIPQQVWWPGNATTEGGTWVGCVQTPATACAHPPGKVHSCQNGTHGSLRSPVVTCPVGFLSTPFSPHGHAHH